MSELDGRITALNLKAAPLPETYFAGSKTFAQPGDYVLGALVHFHVSHGAQTFDKEDCGVLMLAEPNGRVAKIGLDKGQLATAVTTTLALALYKLGPFAKMVVKVTYVGNDKGYKEFECKVAVPAHDKEELFNSIFRGES